MRIFILALAFFAFFLDAAFAQCDDLAALQVMDVAGTLLTADTECTDGEGWTHYYNIAENRILLSIKKNGQDIGSIDAGMTVTAGTLPGYGTGAIDLSGADYISNDFWTVTNRYWQVTGANALSGPVGIRFYFTDTDVADIAQSVAPFGFFVDEPDDLLMFTLGNGNGLYPLATVTQPFTAVFTLYDMVPGPAPDWASGEFNGFPFGEYDAWSLDNGGGAGFLIFLPNPPLSISGDIKKAAGTPVPGVEVQVAPGSGDVTGSDGSYSVPDLIAGSGYEVVPTKDVDHSEYVSVADLIAIARHLAGIEPFSSPYQYIAADANNDQVITFLDIAQIRDVLLGDAPAFPNNTSWRFVPADYVFPDPGNPFMPPFPESIVVNNLQAPLAGQDFIGVKIGDVVEDGNILPPALNTAFSLLDLSTCNPGDTVVFPLTVSDFQGIRAFQFSLNWDAGAMTFLGAEDFALPNFTIANLGMAGTAGGVLTFAWISLLPNGNSLPDGTAICWLRFVAGSGSGTPAPLAFAAVPTDRLLIHQNFSQVVPAAVPGSLLVDNTSDIAATASLTSPGCDGGPTGSIVLNVTAGLPPFQFLWNTGATSQNLTGIGGGTYTVTVTDASGTCPRVFFFEMPDASALLVDGTAYDMSCPFFVDGEIDLFPSGGTAPYAYQWSNGSTKRNPKNLFEGTYTVTVTDAQGCTATASFTIENPNRIFPSVMVVNASSSSATNGAVNIAQINGGTPPFTFLWNTGATSQSLQNIPAGQYIVTITDGLGCQHVYGYEVFGLFTSTFEADGAISAAAIFPNPARPGGTFTLSVETRVAGEVTAVFYTPEGKVVGREAFEVVAGSSLRPVAAPNAGGFYFIQIQMDGLAMGWLKLVVH